MLRQLGSIGLATIALLAFSPRVVIGQNYRWVISGTSSEARWEISPRSNQLRATTCPESPTWRPSEGSDSPRSAAAEFLSRGARARHAVCTEAVSGGLSALDTMGWSGVQGTISVSVDRLVTGLSMRDEYARKTLFETARFPEVRFSIDSLVNVEPGDTLRAFAAGVFELRGVRQAMTVPVRAWRDGDGLRVEARFKIPARDLVERYGMSKHALGLAVNQGIWKAVEVGLDVYLQAVPSELTATR